MKRKNFYKSVLFLVMSVLLFSSCDNDDTWWSENTLVGTWYTESSDGYSATYVEFYSNNQGVIEQYDGNFLTDRTFFYWRANSHSIYFNFTDRMDERWDINFDGRNAFRLYFNDGGYTYFVRER